MYRDLLRELGELLNIYTSGSIANMQRQMFRYDFTGGVIDEAQNLKLQAFRKLLHLHDFTGLCLIFFGNEEVLKRVRTDKGAFAQISRRVPVRRSHQQRHGVEGMDAFKMLRAIGRTYHTDGVVSVPEIARRFVDGSKPSRSPTSALRVTFFPIFLGCVASCN